MFHGLCSTVTGEYSALACMEMKNKKSFGVGLWGRKNDLRFLDATQKERPALGGPFLNHPGV